MLASRLPTDFDVSVLKCISATRSEIAVWQHNIRVLAFDEDAAVSRPPTPPTATSRLTVSCARRALAASAQSLRQSIARRAHPVTRSNHWCVQLSPSELIPAVNRPCAGSLALPKLTVKRFLLLEKRVCPTEWTVCMNSGPSLGRRRVVQRWHVVLRPLTSTRSAPTSAP
jgi:hypothetical protein